MKNIRVAINGFGRIGRVTFRILLERKNVEVVAINDLSDPKTLTHLLKYDSIHRGINAEVTVKGNSMFVNDNEVKIYSEKDPANLPWKE